MCSSRARVQPQGSYEPRSQRLAWRSRRHFKALESWPPAFLGSHLACLLVFGLHSNPRSGARPPVGWKDVVSAGPCERPTGSWSFCAARLSRGSPGKQSSPGERYLLVYLFIGALKLWKGRLGEVWNPDQQPQVREGAPAGAAIL